MSNTLKMEFDTKIGRSRSGGKEYDTGYLYVPAAIVRMGFVGDMKAYQVGKIFSVAHPNASEEDILESLDLFKKEREMYAKQTNTTKENRNTITATTLLLLEQLCRNIGGEVHNEDIQRECWGIFKSCREEGLTHAKSITGMLVAIIYIVSRNREIPYITLERLEDVSGVNKKEIGEYYRYISSNLRIKRNVVKPTDFIPGFAAELGICGITEREATNILDMAMKKGVTSGKGPAGMAGAALKIAGNATGDIKVNDKKILSLPGITKKALDRCYDLILEAGIEPFGFKPTNQKND